MKTITMLELRKDASSVISNLRRGVRLMLTYRGEPIATLVPVSERKKSSDDDPLFCFSEIAQPSPMGKLSHRSIDSLIYE